ncbi:MAG: patatin family protein [Firmicutes bacterium]|nr:patatin family protein [Bacillota bacterium]
MKTMLLLEGGGMRGMYTAGVMDIMLEQGIKVDAIMGVSAGALFGINYKTRQAGRVIRYNKRFAGDKRYMGIHSLITTGNIMNEKFCFDDVPNELDPADYETFKHSPEEFYAVVTNVITGRPEYIRLTDLGEKEQMEYLRASGSLPFVSRPVKIAGQLYLDGGIADSVPVEKALSMGFDRVIVVLTRPEGYRKKRGKDLPAKMLYSRYPAFVKTNNDRWKKYNAQLGVVELLEQEGRIFVVRPSETIKISRLEKDPEVLQAMYDLGVKDAKTRLEDMIRYLNP